MAVTFSHLVRKPYTVQYPDRLPAGVRVQDTLPFRYRGMLEVDLEICTACLACERACPIDCIVIDAVKDKAAGGLVMTRFDIDMGKCMYCGLCSEPCPTGSIHHTPEFEGADYSLESMVRKFVKAPVLAYKPKKGGETDPEIAPILERAMSTHPPNVSAFDVAVVARNPKDEDRATPPIDPRARPSLPSHHPRA